MYRALVLVFLAACLVKGDEKKEIRTYGTIIDKETSTSDGHTFEAISLIRERLVAGEVDSQHIACVSFDKPDPNFREYRRGDELTIKGRTKDDPEKDVLMVEDCIVTNWKSKQ